MWNKSSKSDLHVRECGILYKALSCLTAGILIMLVPYPLYALATQLINEP